MKHFLLARGGLILFFVQVFSCFGAAQVWTTVGPAPMRVNDNPFAGRVSSIAVDPNNGSHWLAGFGNGGVWETRDNGTNWTPLSDNWPTLAIGAIAFAPNDNKTVYVGTGEAVLSGFVKTGVGIMKSTDGGSSWNLLAASSFARAGVRRLRVNPQNANILMAATGRAGYGRDANEGVPGSPAFGVLRSTDGGAHWVRTLAGQATALEVDPNNFNNQYAAIGDNRRNVLNDSPGSVFNL